MKKKKVNGVKEFLSEMLSATGVISAKRVLGALVLLVCLVCIVVLVFREGGTPVVESLLEMAMFVSLGLLGISNITAIWKGPRGTSYNTNDDNYNYNQHDYQVNVYGKEKKDKSNE